MSLLPSETNGKSIRAAALEVTVGPYRPEDRVAVRRIVCDTGLMGEPCARFFDGDEVFAVAVSLYHTDYEPESCFVARYQGRVIGYLIGAKDTMTMDRVSRQKIVLPLLVKAIRCGTFVRGKNLRFLISLLLSVARGEFNEPSFSRDFPATMHINVADGHRAKGVGGRLVAAYLDYLKRAGVPGVHFATFSDRASLFFMKQGFVQLHRTKRSYFRPVLHRDVNLYIFGKRLAKPAQNYL